MIEITEFKTEEIDDTIEALDTLQGILVPFFKKMNFEGLGEQDAQDFVRSITLAKHALIAMGDFLEKKMNIRKPTNGDKIRSMSDEELAEFMFKMGWTLNNYRNAKRCASCKWDDCESCLEDWFKQEAPDDSARLP